MTKVCKGCNCVMTMSIIGIRGLNERAEYRCMIPSCVEFMKPKSADECNDAFII